ncbi:MAG: arginine deiminase-related protein [Paludibacter sp.]|nr:arginine deiminase-related protein [Paludibacter sp.]
MRTQTTNKILMIEPVAFGYNQQTAVNNYFQQKTEMNSVDIQGNALNEFNEMVKIIRANGVDVRVVEDTFEPHTPDSIFPNNWVSFHGEGQVVLYPMYAENRRQERNKNILNYLNEQCCDIMNIVDFTFWEKQNLFLEGTGSMILDRVDRIAYAALSERTDKSVFLQFCKVFQFKPIFFNANQTVGNKRLPIYHTNVMMSVCDEYAVICDVCIDDLEERKKVVDELKNSGKEIITITEDQMLHFAGNMLQVENEDGKLLLIMSQSAYDSLNKNQIERLSLHNELIIIPIPTIEKVGGGSVRCMIAEIF